MPRAPLQKARGYTVVELLVVLGLVVLVGLAVIVLFQDTFRLNRNISESLNTSGEARRALKSMMAEIRTTSPSSLGAYALVTTATSSFIFYSNIDTDVYKERVRYFLQNGILKRGVVKPSGVPLTYNLGSETITELIHSVTNSSTSPIFSYYDSSYAGTTTPLVAPFDIALVRLVKIQIAVDTDQSAGTSTSLYTTQVSFRNLKDNL